MRSGTLNKMAFAAAMLALTACHSRKQTVVNRTPVAAPVENTTAKKLDALRAHQLAFNTFAGKAKARLDIDGNSNDVSLNVRIQHGKKIWVSVTALLGIEVARALITPDSIIVINKFQGVYMQKPFSFVYKYAPKQVNFATVEALLTGNAIPNMLTRQATLTEEGGNTLVTGNMDDLVYKLIFGADYKVSQTNLANADASQALQVANSQFIQSGARIVASQIDIVSAAAGKKININLHYNSADFDQVLEFPFSIPEKYTRVN